MLHGLLHVDWSSLFHAQGSAGEVPQLLKLMERGDSIERAEACRELHACLCADGVVYGAALAAVPFLFELLDNAPSSAERIGLLRLLSDIAADESGRELVARGFGPALRHLRDPHPHVRLLTARVCASLPTELELVEALSAWLPGERALDVRVGFSLVLCGHQVPTLAVFEVDDEDLPLEALGRLATRVSEGKVSASQLVRLLESLVEGTVDDLMDELED